MNFTIKKKLIVAFIGTALLPILILSIVLSSKIKKNSTENFIRSTTNELKQVHNVVSTFFGEVKSNVSMLRASTDYLMPRVLALPEQSRRHIASFW